MVKNEDDIIAETLNSRIEYFDHIIIVDSSTDKTPDICKYYAELYPTKIIYRYDDHPLENMYFRNLLLELSREVAEDGDWIWQLDADHFLLDNHKYNGDIHKLVASAESEKANLIVGEVCQFYITEEDLKAQNSWKGLMHYAVNWRLPIAYKLQSELKMHGKNGETPTVPDKKQASIRPIVLHYQYRSIAQIKKRLEHAYKKGGYGHIYSNDWVDYIINKELLNKVVVWHEIKGGGYNWKTLYLKSQETRNNEEIRRLYGS